MYGRSAVSLLARAHRANTAANVTGACRLCRVVAIGASGSGSGPAVQRRLFSQGTSSRHDVIEERPAEQRADPSSMDPPALSNRRLKHERKSQRLQERQKRLKERKKATSLGVSGRTGRANRREGSALTDNDVQTWRSSMSVRLENQAANDGNGKGDPRQPKEEMSHRIERAALMAQTMDAARSKQPNVTLDDNQRRILANSLIAPGQGTGSNPMVRFESTEIIYPPSDIYPPPLPHVHEVDLMTSARALGVIRSCEFEWDEKLGTGGNWRKTTRSNDYCEEKGLTDYMDNEQALEYLGDSALHLISRSLIMSRFPGKTVAVYNLASSWLVSNDCFAYMFEDSGLEEERLRVARILMAVTKKRELEGAPSSLSPAELERRAMTPCPEPVLPLISHLRKADLLEAYVGAIYLTFGFSATSKWCTQLLAPWLDLIDRTADFHQDRFLSPSGEAYKRALIRELQKEEEEKKLKMSWWGKMRARVFNRS